MTTLVDPIRSGHVVVGVDTHKHIHVAAVMDTIGGILATLTIATDTAGFKQLLEWAASFGRVLAFGVEGTGSYGATLTSYLRRHGHKVIEAGRADRRLRRANGKSDTLDAENAARSVLAGFATAIPKTADGTVEMIRNSKSPTIPRITDRNAAMVTMKAVLRTPATSCAAILNQYDTDQARTPSRKRRPRAPKPRTTRYATRYAPSHAAGTTSTPRPRTSAMIEQLSPPPRRNYWSSSASVSIQLRKSSSSRATTPNGSDPKPRLPSSPGSAPSQPARA